MRFHPPGMEIGARMTVVRLHDGSLFIHSPIELTTELKAALDALGPVAHVVSPSRMHYGHLSDFGRAYPGASFYTVPNFKKRLAAVPATTRLGPMPPAAWSADLDQHIFAGNLLCDEVVFFHAASRSLIVTDLLFNVPKTGLGLLGRFMGALAGVTGRPRPSRSTFLMTRSRAASRRSIKHILDWDFDRIILSHGAIVEHEGKARLRDAFAWLGL